LGYNVHKQTRANNLFFIALQYNAQHSLDQEAKQRKVHLHYTTMLVLMSLMVLVLVSLMVLVSLSLMVLVLVSLMVLVLVSLMVLVLVLLDVCQ
jgi:hypothetical protein